MNSKNLKQILILLGVFLLLILGHGAQFWKFYLNGLLPFPGDILVGFYFPWNSGGFIGFDPFTQYKAQNTVDVIKQMYPWRDFAFEMLKKGQWPLWNPYSFSGMPLIANLQSAVFFPFHGISLFTSTISGWVIIVVAELFFFGWSSYLFLRSQKLSRLASAFGGIVAMNLSYIVLWHAQLVITESLLFLPLILYLVNRYSQSKQSYHLLFISFLLSFCLLGGHAQTGIYVYLIFFLFALYRRVPLLRLILFSASPAFLAAIQLFPSAEAYLLSAREGKATKDLFTPYIFQWENLVTVVAPDFFGHPTTRNFWGHDYRDLNAYFGVTAFVFSLLGAFSWKRFRDIKFFGLITAIGFFLAAWPLVYIFDILNVPILSSGVPARMIFVFQFGAAMLSAYGVEAWLRENPKQLSSATHRTFIVAFVSLGVIWVSAIIEHTHFAVTRNNLLIPTAMISLTCLLIFVKHAKLKLTMIAVAGVFGLVLFQSAYFFEKFNSFSPVAFTFPAHSMVSFLQQQGQPYRFYGSGNAYFNYNFSIYYRIFDIEGYDSMYLKRYGEFAASSMNKGRIPDAIPRSDAVFHELGNRYTKRVFNILGVKYLLDRNDKETLPNWTLDSSLFNPQEYQVVWQEGKFRIYERFAALPRVSLMDNYVVETEKQAILDTLYEEKFPYQSTLVLETTPELLPQKAKQKALTIVRYDPNEIVITTKSDQPQLLYLSDTHYPGWSATIDGKDAEILRANYTFRAVAIPAGTHEVEMTYAPKAFFLGLGVSIVSWALGFVAIVVLVLKERRRTKPYA